MNRELDDSAYRAYLEVMAQQLCQDDPDKLPLVFEGLLAATKRKLYRYKVIDVRDQTAEHLTGGFSFEGRRGWRLIAVDNGKAYFEMDYFFDETTPRDEGEREPAWAQRTLVGEQKEDEEG